MSFASSTIVSVIFKRECMPTWSLARVFESEKQKYAHVKTLLLHKKKEEFLPEDIVDLVMSFYGPPGALSQEIQKNMENALLRG